MPLEFSVSPRRTPVRRSLLPLLLTLGIDTLGTGVFVPISLLYFTRIADLPLAAVGAQTSAGALASLPAPLLTGRLADRFGPRVVVLAGQHLQGVGFGRRLAATSSTPSMNIAAGPLLALRAALMRAGSARPGRSASRC